MKVLTLHPHGFNIACRRLAALAADFRPQIVVGILSGGGEVGRRVAFRMPGAKYCEVCLQRETTGRKKHLRGLLRHMPTFAADWLRRLEARRTAHRRHGPTAVALPAAVTEILDMEAGQRILVVDDAVDSGVTLKAVTDALHAASPESEIRSAVLTVTCPQPLVSPDYKLWNDGTLLRFPWSFDYNSRR